MSFIWLYRSSLDFLLLDKHNSKDQTEKKSVFLPLWGGAPQTNRDRDSVSKTKLLRTIKRIKWSHEKFTFLPLWREGATISKINRNRDFMSRTTMLNKKWWYGKMVIKQNKSHIYVFKKSLISRVSSGNQSSNDSMFWLMFYYSRSSN